MRIEFVEVGNFRKLLAARVDLSPTSTIFVGANNSGKTSAMIAFRKFLSQSAGAFRLQDITLSHIPELLKIGDTWEGFDLGSGEEIPTCESIWSSVLPFLDLWLHVEVGEFHYVQSIMPDLDWSGGLIGVRLRLEPTDLEALFHDFRKAREDAKKLRGAAVERAQQLADENSTPIEEPKIKPWPKDLPDYLDRQLPKKFKLVSYPLDPTKIQTTVPHEIAETESPDSTSPSPQELNNSARPLDHDPLKRLVRVNYEPAQRGMSDETDTGNPEDRFEAFPGGKLSSQLGHYHQKHLDPTDNPAPEDIGALEAIEGARLAFDNQLEHTFRPAFDQVQSMNYPGVTDPSIRVSSDLKAGDLLHHRTSVSYVLAEGGAARELMGLPENQNGLGYQNLISMVFKLMRFRDAWMRVGKAAKPDDTGFEPIHLVLLEEPEAHLHVQVQQVFIRKAYEILRQHDQLGESKNLTTQLVVSTHSSHVAHERPYSCLRYFRRLPAGLVASVPTSTIVNLKEVFGDDESDTKDFVTRYLRSQHADLFFADAAILIEGSAERMLLPHFIKNRFPYLHQCFVTLLEINGSHAHRLRELIEKLGLLTLIITDIDAGKKGAGKNARVSGVQPAKGDNQVTTNATLKAWLPKKVEFDDLIDLSFDKKQIEQDRLFAVRVAYQTKVQMEIAAQNFASGDKPIKVDVFPSTFEDSLAIQNVGYFRGLEGNDITAKFNEALNSGEGWPRIATDMYNALQKGSKASFALDVLNGDKFESLNVPNYIFEGLEWMQERLRVRKSDSLPQEPEND